MPKQGILHDYDLKANEESSAQNQTCVVCGASPVWYQWSDYSGEGMCTQCGCPYQLKWGGDEQKVQNQYPYLNIREDFIPILKEYWNLKHEFVYYGLGFGEMPGLREFNQWLESNHPELCKGEKENATTL